MAEEEEEIVITREFLIQEQLKNRALAREVRQPSAELGATEAILKFSGLASDDETLSEVAHMENDELVAYIAAERSRLAKAKN